MTSKKNPNKLNRFTTLPFLIDLLKTEKLVLLSPKTWEDHNDTDILLEYQNKRKIKGLLALCFTDASETIHHWKYFSNGESGCCIEFNKEKLLATLQKDKIIHKKVSYETIKKGKIINTEDIPFTKRFPYKCESEYRIIMELEEDLRYYAIKIPINSITKVTLSPNLPKSTFETIKEVIKSLANGYDIEINHSTLFNNEDWIEGFRKRSTVNFDNM